MSQLSVNTLSTNEPQAHVHRIDVAKKDSGGLRGDELRQVLDHARTRVAPLWPLESFVAVNPFLGLSGEQFDQAAQTLMRTTGAKLLMPRAYYRSLYEGGRITRRDLQLALESSRDVPGAPADVEALMSALQEDPTYTERIVGTVAAVLDVAMGTEHELLVVQEIAKWCGAYWDDGQSAWRMPWRNLPLYVAWRSATTIDRTADVMGLEGFRDVVASLPEDPVDAIEFILDVLAVPRDAIDGYLHQAMFSVQGWAGYARYLGWHAELAGKPDDTVTELLAIRLAWDYALYVLHSERAFRNDWKDALDDISTGASSRVTDPELTVDAILQEAFDAAYRRGLLGTLERPAAEAGEKARKTLHAAFCIDVRSEVYRRALEEATDDVGTTGFAGFFGIPIEFIPIGQRTGAAQCPVLLQPKFLVRETVAGTNEAEATEILGLRLLRRRAARAWKSFKSSAVSSFVYVETAGLAFAAKLVGDSLGMTRPVKDPNMDGLDRSTVTRLAPDIEPGTMNGQRMGLSASERLDAAEGMLRAMSMTHGFARLVMLTGHGSTTVNNPHASSYHCGACGGNPGHTNARVAAAILNDPRVRNGLVERGITIPEDTWFLGGMHDTTTDEITIYDAADVPATHTADLEQAEQWLRQATDAARRERAPTMKIAGRDVNAQVVQRSRDWSQVRPEWGLARNAAFIAAPRSRTRGLNLEGRAFLHDYTWSEDRGFDVLELILTAPVVVASWISLQYFGSAVDRATFGSGNKVLHNVVGTLGVLEGNGGDLRVGLPSQAVHDGQNLVHEPLRLNVIIEAPTDAIDSILEKHRNVEELVDHGWLHLLALDDEGRARKRDPRTRAWEWVDAEPTS